MSVTSSGKMDRGQGTDFSPKDAADRELLLAWLVKRMSELPREALADLSSMAAEIATCRDQETFEGICQTIREIIFPEIIGGVSEVEPNRKRPEALTRWAQGCGAKVHTLRLERKLTQVQLAERSGLPQSHISRIETGELSASRRTLERLAEALGVDVAKIDLSE